MGNFLYKVLAREISVTRYVSLFLVVLSVLGFAGLAFSQTTTSAGATISGTLCEVFNTVKDVIFILGLTLMILGGAIYAGANLMPASAKGGFMGYGMAMIIGGIIGVAIAVAAPFILNLIVGTNGNAAVTTGQICGSTVTAGGTGGLGGIA